MKQEQRTIPVPHPHLSRGFSQTKNQVFIGDNLDVLRWLIKTCPGQIGTIVTDPPYGRGHGDTAYQDNLSNPSSWMSFLRPRLELSRELLAPDGVILIHIDDKKVHWLRTLLDELFGERNYLNTIIWHYGATSRFSARIRSSHEYILAYAKNLSAVKINPVQTEKLKYLNIVPTVQRLSKKFGFSVDDGLTALGIHRDAETGELFEWYSRRAQQRDYLSGPIDDVWNLGPVNRMAKEHIKGFLGQKPVSLVKRLLNVFGKDNGIVLDIFAGTGTTGQAVLELNRDDGGHRAYILVQSPEECRETALLECGYRQISDITLSRLHKVSEQYQKPELDAGFQVFTL